MSRQLGLFVRFYTWIIQKAADRWYTALYRIKYLPYLKVHGHVVLKAGLKIDQFLFRNEKLCVVLSGNNTIGRDTEIQGSGELLFGNNSYCGSRCIFGVNERISIGNNVMIAQHVTIRDSGHQFSRTDIPMLEQGIETSEVLVGNDVWIGHGAIILKGVTISDGAVIAAGSVVTRNVDSFHIVAGVPARVIGKRAHDE
jgi:acetyltransferase-like isoleucine patch superfamily enzyme